MRSQYEISYGEYKVLYARYLDRASLQNLLKYAGSLEEKVVLDLCGGGGRLSLAALKRGAAEVYLIDDSFHMTNSIDHALVREGPLTCIHKRLNKTFGFKPFRKNSVDVAFCQQGINYWFTEEMIRALWERLKPGGMFIFNTFNKRPSVKPVIRQYVRGNRKYVEISWLKKRVGKRPIVHHVQCVEGMKPHINEFMWIPPKDFYSVLWGYFARVKEIRKGRTSIYVCTKLKG